MDIFRYLKESLERSLGKKLNANQLQIIRNVAVEYREELIDNLDDEVESLVQRIKANNGR